jgi:hypothetical protein
MSISNDIFNPDHAIGGFPIEAINNPDAEPRKVPPPIKAIMDSTHLQVSKPDGSLQSDYPLVDFHRKSVSAVNINQDGTYRIALVQNPIYLTWFNKSDNSPGRLFGKLESIKKMLPEGAKDIRTTKLINTVETYVTRNNVSTNALKLSEKGLELKYHSHPNELFVGESLTLSVLFNGESVGEGFSIHMVRNDTRYRNNRETADLKTNKSGEIKIEWRKPGLYLLEIEHKVDSIEKGVSSETHANYVVLEVFQE